MKRLSTAWHGSQQDKDGVETQRTVVAVSHSGRPGPWTTASVRMGPRSPTQEAGIQREPPGRLSPIAGIRVRGGGSRVPRVGAAGGVVVCPLGLRAPRGGPLRPREAAGDHGHEGRPHLLFLPWKGSEKRGQETSRRPEARRRGAAGRGPSAKETPPPLPLYSTHSTRHSKRHRCRRGVTGNSRVTVSVTVASAPF